MLHTRTSIEYRDGSAAIAPIIVGVDGPARRVQRVLASVLPSSARSTMSSQIPFPRAILHHGILASLVWIQ